MTDPTIRAHARAHVKELTARTTELVGDVIAKGMISVLEECITMHVRIQELEAELARRTQPAPVVEQGDLEAVAEAIFKVMKDSNMTDKDWKNGSILGFENSFRDQIKEAATAALAATNRSQP